MVFIRRGKEVTEEINLMMKMYRYYRKNIVRGYAGELLKAVKGCRSIIDLGCGPDSPVQHIDKSVHKIGVDIDEPWLNQSKKKGIFDEYVLADIRNIFETSLPEIDCVLLLDVIEHLEKEEGIRLLEQAEKFAREKVIVSTPNGFMRQDRSDSDPYSEHKSGWNTEDFEERGYEVIGINGWKKLRKEGGYMRYKPGILCFLLSEITQLSVKNRPRHAHQILAIKRTNKF